MKQRSIISRADYAQIRTLTKQLRELKPKATDPKPVQYIVLESKREEILSKYIPE